MPARQRPIPPLYLPPSMPCPPFSLPQAHTNVDVRLDIPAFRSLLADRLPLVFAGWPVEAAAIPWPVQEGADDDGGMS